MLNLLIVSDGCLQC